MRSLVFITLLLFAGFALATFPQDENIFDELYEDEFPKINKFSVFHPWKEFAIEKKCDWLDICPPMEPHFEKRNHETHGFPQELDCPKDDDIGCGFCNSTRDCNNHGICSDANYCICDDEYWKENCQATRKKELTAFLLTLLVGPIFGLPPCAGRFYMGYTGIAVAQLILGCMGLILCIPSCCLSCCAQTCKAAAVDDDDDVNVACLPCLCGIHLLSCGVSCFGILCGIAAVAWWLADWIMILTGDLEPVNGPFYKNL